MQYVHRLWNCSYWYCFWLSYSTCVGPTSLLLAIIQLSLYDGTAFSGWCECQLQCIIVSPWEMHVPPFFVHQWIVQYYNRLQYYNGRIVVVAIIIYFYICCNLSISDLLWLLCGLEVHLLCLEAERLRFPPRIDVVASIGDVGIWLSFLDFHDQLARMQNHRHGMASAAQAGDNNTIDVASSLAFTHFSILHG